MKIYKIRNKEGLYSTGGMAPKFTAKGKNWKNIGHIKNHLGEVIGLKKSVEFYKDCEIVTFEIKEEEVSTTSFEDYLLESIKSKKAKEEAYKAKQRLEEIRLLESKLEKLKSDG